MLIRMGHRVLLARIGGPAIDLLTEYEGDVDLLLSDIVVPVMSGFEVAEGLRSRKPSIGVLFMSGHVDLGDLHARLLTNSRVVAKPFSHNTLAQQLNLRRSEPIPQKAFLLIHKSSEV